MSDVDRMAEMVHAEWAAEEAADKLRERIAELERQLAEARETNRHLHRRTQEAEAAIPSYQRLIAIPPDGDGIRLAGGNMGRSLLTWYCTQLLERAESAEQQLTAAREREGDARDAERYRWLRDIDADGWPAVRVPCPCPDGIPYPRCTVKHTTPMRGEALDAAIDAARQQEAARES